MSYRFYGRSDNIIIRRKGNEKSKKKQKKAQMNPKKKTAILVAVVAAVFLLCVGIIIAVTRSEGSTGSDNTDQTANDESTADTKDTAENVTADASYYADIDVKDYGTITVALDAKHAPKTVENFVSLAKSGFYDGLTFPPYHIRIYDTGW